MKYVGLYDNDKDIVTKEKLDAAIPTKTSQLENDSGFITSAPVTSVNTKTGAVELTASDVGAQDKITVEGILKGDGTGGITAALANVEYATCTKLLNGGARGSLRTSGASAEDSTYTMGIDAFAQGSSTKASGNYSHAEGSGTMATALMSHAEGVATIASGYASHTEGTGTTANHNSQHAQGQFNIADNSTADSTERGNYAHIVGNGTSDTDRSNAHTLDWSGNAWFAGDVYIGSTSGKNKDDGSKKLATEDLARSLAQSYSMYYAYCTDGNIAGESVTIENMDALCIVTSQYIDSLFGKADYIGVSKPVIVAGFYQTIIDAPVLLLFSDVAFSNTIATFEGVYHDAANNKTFLCRISINYGDQSVTGVGYTEISKSDTFIATIGTTSYNDVLTAFNAGKIIYAKDTDGNMYQLSAEMDAPTIFSFINFYLAINHSASYEVRGYTLSSDSGWSEEITYGDSLIPQPSHTLPLAPGTAATGTSIDYARADHVHPIDTTRVPIARTINGKSLASNITLGSTKNATLASSGWTSSSGTLTQTLTVSGIVAIYNAAPTIDLALDKVAAANKKSVADAWGKISGYMEANTAANSITFTVYADTAPTVNIPIRITTYD